MPAEVKPADYFDTVTAEDVQAVLASAEAEIQKGSPTTTGMAHNIGVLAKAILAGGKLEKKHQGDTGPTGPVGAHGREDKPAGSHR